MSSLDWPQFTFMRNSWCGSGSVLSGLPTGQPLARLRVDSVETLLGASPLPTNGDYIDEGNHAKEEVGQVVKGCAFRAEAKEIKQQEEYRSRVDQDGEKLTHQLANP